MEDPKIYIRTYVNRWHSRHLDIWNVLFHLDWISSGFYTWMRVLTSWPTSVVKSSHLADIWTDIFKSEFHTMWSRDNKSRFRFVLTSPIHLLSFPGSSALFWEPQRCYFKIFSCTAKSTIKQVRLFFFIKSVGIEWRIFILKSKGIFSVSFSRADC